MPFALYDTLLYTSRPTSAELGLTGCKVLYQGPLYAEGNEGATTAPKRSVVESLVAASTEPLICFDIESVINQADFITTIGWARAIRSNALYGAYGYGPTQLNNIGVTFGIDHASYISWQAGNDDIAPLLAVLDFLAPSLYFRNGRIHQAMITACAVITEAARIAPGKPLLPFIWPHYIESLSLPKADTDCADGDWDQWLRFIKTGDMTGVSKGAFWGDSWSNTGVPGALLWGGYLTAWNGNASWWLRTQAFQAAVVAEVSPSAFRT